MRRRGLTLLEVLIAAAVLAVLTMAAFSLLDTSTSIYSNESVRQLAQTEAEKVVDTIAEDMRAAAAWDFFRVTNPAGPGNPGDSVTRLTKFFAAVRKTRGAYPNDGTAPFAWAPVRSDLNEAVAFLRVRGHRVVPNTAGYPAYLVLDFEPLGLGGAAGDAGADGGTLQDNQPGRMNDDLSRQFILYRTRVVAKRVVVERVRGIASITNDGSDTGTLGSSAGLLASPTSVVAIGDLGPAGPALPVGVSPGSLEIEAFDTGSATGAGAIRIRAVARGLQSHGGTVKLVTADIETQVAVTCGAPPF